jgi:hypothetical protein
MDAELQKKIQDKVLEILTESNLDETTEFQIRKAASQQLDIDLSLPDRKKFVRQVVESYLKDQRSKDEPQETLTPEEEEEEEQSGNKGGAGPKEYDDDGDLIICRLTNKRRVTITAFKGKTLVSMREYYNKDGKELPTSKGISLTTEQWSIFSKNVPAIEKAVRKMESRLN